MKIKLADLMEMPISELEELQSDVFTALKFQRDKINLQKARELSIGDEVQWESRGGGIFTGRVEKINRKTVIVNTPTAGRWKVSTFVVKKIEK